MRLFAVFSVRQRAAPYVRGIVTELDTEFRPLDGTSLACTLTVPDAAASGLAVLVHGAGVTRREGGFFTRLAAGLAEAGVQCLRFDLRARAIWTADVFLRSVAAPALLVHGTGDTFVPVDSSCRYLPMFGGPVELMELEGAQHGLAVHGDPQYLHPQSQAWQAQVIKWVTEFLTA